MELPGEFLKMLRGEPAYAGLEEALLTPPSVSVRVNSAKGAVIPSGADRVPWCPEGFYLPERPQFTFDPALHQGLYYVQDASSMVMGYVASKLSQGRPMRWLDACAAPGGKTTAVLSSLPQGSLVVANEYDGKRARALVENVERWGYGNVAVSQGDTKAFRKLQGFFDVVAVDAPCSGEGMMRKEAVAVSQWSPALVCDCAALQREILDNVWPALRPGGVLVFSTCTFNRAENEENVRWLCREYGAESIDLGLTEFEGVAPGINTEDFCARFFPGRVRGEGLFITAVRKPGDSPVVSCPAKGIKSVKAPGPWLKGDWTWVMNGENLQAWPSGLAGEINKLDTTLKLVHAGVTAGFVKGRDIVPSFALAHAVDVNAGVGMNNVKDASSMECDKTCAWPTVEVDYTTALAILRGEPVNLSDAPKGIVLTTYNGNPLAFMKNLGNRANNLVPSARRILSPVVPATPVHVIS